MDVPQIGSHCEANHLFIFNNYLIDESLQFWRSIIYAFIASPLTSFTKQLLGLLALHAQHRATMAVKKKCIYRIDIVEQ